MNLIARILLIFTLFITARPCTDITGNTCTHCLSQSNFLYGTYQITESGLYCLEQNIIFNPNAGSNSYPNERGAWFPMDDILYPGSTAQSGGGYALGFFAVIAIESSNVILDLNHYKIEYGKSFYLQQRFGAIIEIANSPFLPNVGPADFGSDFKEISNVTIQNGELGLSSHHGIHSNNASNIYLSNLRIYDFEVGGIQLNGFSNAYFDNLQIGPSLQNVPLTGYYSNARFILLAFRKLLNAINAKDLSMPHISFAYMEEDDEISLVEVYYNLIESMDLVFRELSDKVELTEDERNSVLYSKAMGLFNNTHRLPDGSAIYGILLNSFSVAINGFGASDNDGLRKGANITMTDIDIDDLVLNVTEIPAIYFDRCSDPESSEITILTGPFGDVMDIRKMVSDQDRLLIDEYDVVHPDLGDIQYIGNPLADAQIALYLYGTYADDGNDYAFGSFVSEYFLDWALNDEGVNNSFPTCAQFVCNGDIMFHTNKGVIGLRLDNIEDAKMEDVSITNLYNKSPFASDTCSNYSGPHDGGIGGTSLNQGGMNTDLRGLSISGGDLIISGENNSISNLVSYYGDTIGIDLMDGAILEFEYDTNLTIDNLDAAIMVNYETYEYLVEINKTPYPNNFNFCTIQILDDSTIINAPNEELTVTDCDLPLSEYTITEHILFNTTLIMDKFEMESEGVFGYGIPVDVLALSAFIGFMVISAMFLYWKCCKESVKNKNKTVYEGDMVSSSGGSKTYSESASKSYDQLNVKIKPKSDAMDDDDEDYLQ